jgi:cilia- and flagella-associated protein 57
MEYK